ncbi:hypothetical protein QC763_0048480 [Podospora pseudopauciseta]|uniref:Uncharacterized protein n=2 Tax=Podospora TaxID=5144 RepID=A0ABR0HEZ1_9PEZI|nr:hypothetical protein QC763_0048480 [Podospora pseudopauciseta]KAK4677750.1 hypothetical protein QC764_0048090 [Podospora pseudoanserina]
MRGRGKQDKDVEKLMRTSKDVKLSWEATLWETSLSHVFSNAPKIYNAPWKMTQLRPILLLSSSYV